MDTAHPVIYTRKYMTKRQRDRDRERVININIYIYIYIYVSVYNTSMHLSEDRGQSSVILFNSYTYIESHSAKIRQSELDTYAEAY